MVTGPDNTFTTTEYDEIERVKAVKDVDGNLRKSYNYNYPDKVIPNRTFNVNLETIENGNTVASKTLSDTDSYTATSEDENLLLTLQLSQNVGSCNRQDLI